LKSRRIYYKIYDWKLKMKDKNIREKMVKMVGQFDKMNVVYYK
jgi:hypothetical protein